jgi:hypothetical protein
MCDLCMIKMNYVHLYAICMNTNAHECQVWVCYEWSMEHTWFTHGWRMYKHVRTWMNMQGAYMISMKWLVWYKNDMISSMQVWKAMNAYERHMYDDYDMSLHDIWMIWWQECKYEKLWMLMKEVCMICMICGVWHVMFVMWLSSTKNKIRNKLPMHPKGA